MMVYRGGHPPAGQPVVSTGGRELLPVQRGVAGEVDMPQGAKTPDDLSGPLYEATLKKNTLTAIKLKTITNFLYGFIFLSP